ncbi:MAG TPA: ABC transporter ATP-binding protein [Acidimicrobiales bacterium]
MLLRLLRNFLRRYRWVLVAVCVFQFLQTLCTLYLPTLNANIINKGILTGDNAYIWRTGLLMLGITVVQIVFAITAVYYGSRASMGFGRDVRSGLFHTVTSFSTKEVNAFGAPSLITRITNDVQQVQMLVFLTCTLLIAAPFTAIGGIVLAVREDGGLSLLLVVSIPVLLICVGSVISRMVPQYRLMQDRIDSVNQVLREQITGVRVVRAFVREPEETKRFDGANVPLTETSLRAGHLMAFMFPTVTIVLNLSSVAAIWIGSSRIAAGDLSIGALVAFLSYLIQILMAVMMATFMAVLVPRASVCAERIQEVLDTEPSVRAAATPVTTVNQRSGVELRDVVFAYPGAEEPVLADITLHSRPGQTTAIVGGTGAGKTTLVNLILRLFDVTGGAVLVDGIDVRDLQPELLWSRIGLVPQKPYLFSGTVASNLRYGKPDATEEEMWAALEIAQARDYVAAMPGGLEGRIAQGGTNVSGGQRQRLAIARAVIRRPEIYLFDDSFSALDLATDARLRAALAPHTADATVLVVAQRISTVVSADQILVLDDGRPIGLGTHHELLATCPTYAEIVASQTRGQDAA